MIPKEHSRDFLKEKLARLVVVLDTTESPSEIERVKKCIKKTKRRLFKTPKEKKP